MDFWDSYKESSIKESDLTLNKKSKKSVSARNGVKADSTQININISLPKVKIDQKVARGFKLSTKRVKTTFWLVRSKLTKKVLNISLVAVIVFSLGMIAIQSFAAHRSQEVAVVDGASAESRPDFKLVYPSGSSKDTSYDANKKVASFNDRIGQAKLTISQQSLPVNFRYDPNGEVEKLAKQINANTKLEAAGISAFMGQSIKGPQTVVFSKNGLLIFVKSESIVDTKNWNDYVSSFN